MFRVLQQKARIKFAVVVLQKNRLNKKQQKLCGFYHFKQYSHILIMSLCSPPMDREASSAGRQSHPGLWSCSVALRDWEGCRYRQVGKFGLTIRMCEGLWRLDIHIYIYISLICCVFFVSNIKSVLQRILLHSWLAWRWTLRRRRSV